MWGVRWLQEEPAFTMQKGHQSHWKDLLPCRRCAPELLPMVTVAHILAQSKSLVQVQMQVSIPCALFLFLMAFTERQSQNKDPSPEACWSLAAVPR